MRHLALTLAAALLVLFAATPGAHEIPTDVRIYTFLKPEAQRLRYLLRVPVASMLDVEWPTSDGVVLDLSNPARLEAALQDGAMYWIVSRTDMYEDGRKLEPRLAAARISLPIDTSFDSYDRALASTLSPPLPPETEVAMNQALVDILLEYPIQSDRSQFSIDARYQKLGLQTMIALQFLTPDGAVRAFQFHEDPGLVRLDPRWFQAAWGFTVSGFFHILEGIDHLLFLGCLVIPFRRLRSLVPIVTAFTLAHSVTLIASAYGMAPDTGWFPPLVETLIAASIVYMALENIVAPGLVRRWAISFAFGLVHGFGFSFALRETMQFAGNHLLTSLLTFNLGVELGQLAVLFVMVPALDLLFRYGVAERVGTILLSALVAHTGWHWMTDRFAQFRLYPFEAPVLDAFFYLMVVRWLIVFVLMAGAGWLISTLMKQAGGRGRDKATVSAEEA
jgi:hypothetical protein